VVPLLVKEGQGEVLIGILAKEGLGEVLPGYFYIYRKAEA
jgi:hypothetical protein